MVLDEFTHCGDGVLVAVEVRWIVLGCEDGNALETAPGSGHGAVRVWDEERY